MIDDETASVILTEMVQISRTLRVASQRSPEQNLTGTRFGILQYLRHCDARLGELAQQLFVSAPVTTRAVESLEAEGLVERRTDPDDARAFLISITEEGRARVVESERRTVHSFAAALAGWSTAEAVQAVELLKRLNQHLSDVMLASDPQQAAQVCVRSGIHPL